jgi:hypothetical protein
MKKKGAVKFLQAPFIWAGFLCPLRTPTGSAKLRLCQAVTSPDLLGYSTMISGMCLERLSKSSQLEQFLGGGFGLLSVSARGSCGGRVLGGDSLESFPAFLSGSEIAESNV